MAITKGAKKAIRTSARKRVFNLRRKTTLHDVTKDFRAYITSNNHKEAAALIPSVYKAIDKAAKRGVIKQNTADRKKSRLMKQLRKMELAGSK